MPHDCPKQPTIEILHMTTYEILYIWGEGRKHVLTLWLYQNTRIQMKSERRIVKNRMGFTVGQNKGVFLPETTRRLWQTISRSRETRIRMKNRGLWATKGIRRQPFDCLGCKKWIIRPIWKVGWTHHLTSMAPNSAKALTPAVLGQNNQTW